MSTPVLDSEIDVGADLGDTPPLCESDHCERLGRGAHEAHYRARFPLPCPLSYSICQRRFEEYRYQNYIRCEACPEMAHPWRRITVTKL